MLALLSQVEHCFEGVPEHFSVLTEEAPVKAIDGLAVAISIDLQDHRAADIVAEQISEEFDATRLRSDIIWDAAKLKSSLDEPIVDILRVMLRYKGQYIESEVDGLS